jgi:hypothetical protein
LSSIAGRIGAGHRDQTDGFDAWAQGAEEAKVIFRNPAMELNRSCSDPGDEAGRLGGTPEVRDNDRQKGLGKARDNVTGSLRGEVFMGSVGKLEGESDGLHSHLRAEKGLIERGDSRDLDSWRPRGFGGSKSRGTVIIGAIDH